MAAPIPRAAPVTSAILAGQGFRVQSAGDSSIVGAAETNDLSVDVGPNARTAGNAGWIRARPATGADGVEVDEVGGRAPARSSLASERTTPSRACRTAAVSDGAAPVAHVRRAVPNTTMRPEDPQPPQYTRVRASRRAPISATVATPVASTNHGDITGPGRRRPSCDLGPGGPSTRRAGIAGPSSLVTERDAASVGPGQQRRVGVVSTEPSPDAAGRVARPASCPRCRWHEVLIPVRHINRSVHKRLRMGSVAGDRVDARSGG